jgi:hypothetical protein
LAEIQIRSEEKKMKKSLIGLVFGMFALVATVGFNFATAQAQAPRAQLGGGRLDGAWDVRVTLFNCVTGATIRSFDSVTQFMKGGTLIDSTSAMPQALKTPGQGIWRHDTGDSYIFRFKVFTFDAAGNYTGYQIVSQRANLDPDGSSYVSVGTAQFFTPNGTLIMTGCSSTTASRMVF